MSGNTDWQWCYENPHDAASEIDRTQVMSDNYCALLMDANAALAAKDARIAEMSESIRDMLYAQHVRPSCQDGLIDRCQCWGCASSRSDSLAAQQQAEPAQAKNAQVAATHSEDGREVPRFDVEMLKGGKWRWAESPEGSMVRHADHAGHIERIVAGIVSDCWAACGGNGPATLDDLLTALRLMDEAEDEHERIVAAKDAEIDALKGIRNQYWDDWNEAASNLIEMTRERDELRAQITAQPARQVDGDEREAAIAQFALTLPMTSESAAGGNTYDQELRRYYLLGWDDRAALAPAAVAVVLPERMRTRGETPAARVSWIGGYNSALDEVARLNRRAIPAGLLSKLANCTDPDCCIAHARAELRALLGKDGDL